MISYEPLWKTLEIKGYSTYWLLNHGVVQIPAHLTTHSAKN